MRVLLKSKKYNIKSMSRKQFFRSFQRRWSPNLILFYAMHADKAPYSVSVLHIYERSLCATISVNTFSSKTFTQLPHVGIIWYIDRLELRLDMLGLKGLMRVHAERKFEAQKFLNSMLCALLNWKIMRIFKRTSACAHFQFAIRWKL